MKSATRTSVPWLSAEQAAVHLGYVRADGTPNLPAFYVWKHRAKPTTHHLRGRLRFRQTDLDACVDPEPSAQRPRLSLVRSGA